MHTPAGRRKERSNPAAQARCLPEVLDGKGLPQARTYSRRAVVSRTWMP